VTKVLNGIGHARRTENSEGLQEGVQEQRRAIEGTWGRRDQGEPGEGERGCPLIEDAYDVSDEHLDD